MFKKFQSGLVFADESADLTPTVIQRFDTAPRWAGGGAAGSDAEAAGRLSRRVAELTRWLGRHAAEPGPGAPRPRGA